jgi:hypothetical protein
MVKHRSNWAAKIAPNSVIAIGKKANAFCADGQKAIDIGRLWRALALVMLISSDQMKQRTCPTTKEIRGRR